MKVLISRSPGGVGYTLSPSCTVCKSEAGLEALWAGSRSKCQEDQLSCLKVFLISELLKKFGNRQDCE